VSDEQGGHSRLIHADAQAVTGYAGLCYFEYRIANSVSITNADFVIRKSFNREILSELSEVKIIAPKEMLPVSVRIDLVNGHGALLATVTSEIGLRIAINIELAHHPSPLSRKFPDRRSHRLAVPCNVAGKTDI
jgi:hypothetical protein